MAAFLKKEHILFFGKYKGKTVKEVMDIDMPYIHWLMEKKGISFEGVEKTIEEPPKPPENE